MKHEELVTQQQNVNYIKFVNRTRKKVEVIAAIYYSKVVYCKIHPENRKKKLGQKALYAAFTQAFTWYRISKYPKERKLSHLLN